MFIFFVLYPSTKCDPLIWLPTGCGICYKGRLTSWSVGSHAQPGQGFRSVGFVRILLGKLSFCILLYLFMMMTTMVRLFIFSFCIRPSNVHAYTREVRPEHGRYRVERKAYSNYGANGLLVSELPTDHGSELPIDLCLELFYTSQSMRMLNNWTHHEDNDVDGGDLHVWFLYIYFYKDP